MSVGGRDEVGLDALRGSSLLGSSLLALTFLDSVGS